MSTVVNVALHQRCKLNATVADVRESLHPYALFLAALILVVGGSLGVAGQQRITRYEVALLP